MKFLPLSAPSVLSAVAALIVSGCSTPPALPAVTAAVPATCPHPGVIWGPWSTITIGTLVKTSRVRECRQCGWVQTQSEFKPTP